MTKDLTEALRQYRHNGSNDFVFGYDLDVVDKLVSTLQLENDSLINLITECTQDGELDSRLIKAYMEYFVREGKA